MLFRACTVSGRVEPQWRVLRSKCISPTPQLKHYKNEQNCGLFYGSKTPKFFIYFLFFFPKGKISAYFSIFMNSVLISFWIIFLFTGLNSAECQKRFNRQMLHMEDATHHHLKKAQLIHNIHAEKSLIHYFFK